MGKQELIEQFESSLHNCLKFYIKNIQKNYKAYSQYDELVEGFYCVYEREETIKTSEYLIASLMSPIHLLNVYIGGFHIALGGKPNKLIEAQKMYLKNMDLGDYEVDQPTISYEDYASYYYPSEKELPEKLHGDKFVPFDQPYEPIIQNDFYSFLLKQDEKDIENIYYQAHGAEFKYA